MIADHTPMLHQQNPLHRVNVETMTILMIENHSILKHIADRMALVMIYPSWGQCCCAVMRKWLIWIIRIVYWDDQIFKLFLWNSKSKMTVENLNFKWQLRIQILKCHWRTFKLSIGSDKLLLLEKWEKKKFFSFHNRPQKPREWHNWSFYF